MGPFPQPSQMYTPGSAHLDCRGYAAGVHELMSRRFRPFAVVGVITVVVSVAVARLPDSLVELMQRKTPLTLAEVGWAYRLLAFAAVAQALYGGFVLLRPDHIEAARRKDPKVAALPRARLIGIVARTAASMLLFTLIYGLAAFIVGGQRGGFWLFPLLVVAQGAWYYRQVGQVAKWAGFQPEPVVGEPGRGAWQREPADYTPPLARGLTPVTPASTED